MIYNYYLLEGFFYHMRIHENFGEAKGYAD